jgi:hypothetical protein
MCSCLPHVVSPLNGGSYHTRTQCASGARRVWWSPMVISTSCSFTYMDFTTRRSSTLTFTSWTPRPMFGTRLKALGIGQSLPARILLCCPLQEELGFGLAIFIYYTHCCDGVRLYTIRVDDRTMSCTLLPGPCDDMCWVVPSR